MAAITVSDQIHHNQTDSKLLIVDDQAHQRSLMTQMFKDTYRVTTVCDGPTALAILRTWDFDVALVDMRMPDMTGLEVLKHIRNGAKTEHLPVILLSSPSDSQQLVSGLEMGANDYLMKPLDNDLALARVRAQVAFKKKLDSHQQIINKLQRVQEDQDRLVKMITHDLKHPVANLRMAEMILREYITQSAESALIIESMLSSLDALEEVLGDFESAFEVGKMQDINLEPIVVDDLIHRATMQYCASAMKKAIQIEVGATDGVIYADQHRMAQIIGNLVSNAIKYGPLESAVRVWSEQRNGTIRIHVADEGQGVPANERDKLFTEFGRLSPRPTGHEASTGLGLWIVKNLTESMRGQVGVAFPVGGGSIFWVDLPAYVAAGV